MLVFKQIKVLFYLKNIEYIYDKNSMFYFVSCYYSMGIKLSRPHYHKDTINIDTYPQKNIYYKCTNKKCKNHKTIFFNKPTGIIYDCNNNCNCHINLLEDL